MDRGSEATAAQGINLMHELGYGIGSDQLLVLLLPLSRHLRSSWILEYKLVMPAVLYLSAEQGTQYTPWYPTRPVYGSSSEDWRTVRDQQQIF